MAIVSTIIVCVIFCFTVVVVVSLRTARDIQRLDVADRVEHKQLESKELLQATYEKAAQRIEDLCREAERRIEKKRIDVVEPEGLDEDEQRLFSAWQSAIKELSRWDVRSDISASLERARMIAMEMMRRKRLR
jgi:hypothetical protein